VVYGDDYVFQFSKGHVLRESPEDRAIIITSNRGVHEALAASALEPRNRSCGYAVHDEPLYCKLYEFRKETVFCRAEQRYLLDSFLKNTVSPPKALRLGTESSREYARCNGNAPIHSLRNL